MFYFKTIAIISVIMNQPTDLRYPSEAEDLQLANKFRNIMQAVLKEDS